MEQTNTRPSTGIKSEDSTLKPVNNIHNIIGQYIDTWIMIWKGLLPRHEQRVDMWEQGMTTREWGCKSLFQRLLTVIFAIKQRFMDLVRLISWYSLCIYFILKGVTLDIACFVELSL